MSDEQPTEALWRDADGNLIPVDPDGTMPEEEFHMDKISAYDAQLRYLINTQDHLIDVHGVGSLNIKRGLISYNQDYNTKDAKQQEHNPVPFRSDD